MRNLQRWIVLSVWLVGLVGCQALSPPPETITWAWTYKAGDYIRSRPVVADAVVYVGADDNQMHAVDADTGEARWTYATMDNVTSAAAVMAESIYFGSWDGSIYALDTSGAERWHYPTAGWVSATPLLHDGVLYVGSQDGRFYALDAASGEPRWHYRTGGRIEQSAVMAGELVIFTSTDGYLHALDRKSGERRWFFYTGGGVVAPPVIGGGQLYVGTLERTLYALAIPSGQLRWTFTTAAAIGATPTVDVASESVFVATDDGQLYALATSDGHPRWHQALGELIRSTPALWHELLFVATNQGNLYALEGSSGRTLWHYRLGGAVTQGPTISNNRLYVGSMISELQAFDLAPAGVASLRASAPSVLEAGREAALDAGRPLDPQAAARFDAQRAAGQTDLAEYQQLWQAIAAMPTPAAVSALHQVIAFRPQSPAAYRAHLTLARHYAAQEAPAARAAYQAALLLDDTIPLRLEVANYLEQQGDGAAAYAEYQAMLRRQPDAFAGMRRTGPDPLQVAADLQRALYYTDVLETLHAVADPAAVPLRAQAYLNLGRYEEAATAYRTQIQANPGDEDARMGLALAQAWLSAGEVALDLYSTVDTPESRRRQAQLLAADAPERALALYLASPAPSAWWAATALLESQGRITETLPIYERMATTDSPYADDAAYRLYVLGTRLENTAARASGERLLAELGLNWLALRSGEEPLQLETAPAMITDMASDTDTDIGASTGTGSGLAPGADIIAKVAALDAIGRPDLAQRELRFALRFRRTPALGLAMAQAVAARGDIRAAQRYAEQAIDSAKFAPRAVWLLSYPRPYAETVYAAATEFGVDPLLIWAVMREESRFDPDARSPAQARGLMQVIPATQSWIAEMLGEHQVPGDAYGPETSIRMGAWLLGFLSDYFDGDLELAVPAYNAGAGSVEYWQADPLVEDRDDLLRWIGYDETRLYLKRVALSHQIYRALYGAE